MSEGLDRLKKLGAQKIYEDTHIPVNQVQAILYENYDGLTKVQFVGFISILEREYREDLTEIKARGIAYFDEQKLQDEAEYTERIYAEPEKNRAKMLLIVIFLLLIVLGATYFILTKSELEHSSEEFIESDATEKLGTTQTTSIEAQEENSLPSNKENRTVVVDTNKTKTDVISQENNLSKSSKETNETSSVKNTTQESIQKSKEEQKIVSSLVVLPKTKVWLGYIDVKSHKKYQKTVRKSFHLDPKKEWLLLFGHGYVTIAVDGVKHVFSQKEQLRLHYKDGVISKVTKAEFKRLNRGRAW